MVGMTQFVNPSPNWKACTATCLVIPVKSAIGTIIGITAAAWPEPEEMKKYRCTVCEWVYDPAVGDPDGGIAPGTQFEEIPEDWVCPVCGVGKDMFEEVAE